LILKNYLKKIADTTARGDAREESYYEYLSSFFKNIAQKFGKKKIDVTTLPKKTEAGNPDFRIWDGKQHIVGYIEAKAPDTNLDIIETSEQLKRYRTTFPNLILTNFYEFRLYRDGELIERVSIGRPFIAKKLKTIPPLEKEKEFTGLLEKFFSFSLPKSYTASGLAVELAKRTRFLKDEVIFEELKEEKEGKGDIIGFYEAFIDRKELCRPLFPNYHIRAFCRPYQSRWRVQQNACLQSYSTYNWYFKRCIQIYFIGKSTQTNGSHH
jgi:hypothetical protein